GACTRTLARLTPLRLYSSGAPPHLHSFPTRRSSDLDQPGRLEVRVDWGRYRLEVYDAATGIASSQRFYAGWWAQPGSGGTPDKRSEEHTSELQSRENLVCRLLLEKKKTQKHMSHPDL